MTFLCITWNLLRDDNFVGRNKFFESDNLGISFLNSALIKEVFATGACIKDILAYASNACTKGIVLMVIVAKVFIVWVLVSRLFIAKLFISNILVEEILITGLLVLAIFLPEKLVLGVLVLKMYLLEVIALGVLMPEVLVPLNTRKYTRNIFISWKWSYLGLDYRPEQELADSYFAYCGYYIGQCLLKLFC